MNNETEAYERLLCGHLKGMEYFLRHLPEDKLDWTFAPPAPTPRIIATHALQWLICDRYHINEPDAAKHPRIPDLPHDQTALCDALAEETENWRTLIRSLTPEQLNEVRYQFNETKYEMNVRGFLCHMIQHCVYKNGQLSTLFFGLGLDGTEPYRADFPNAIYDELLR